ncbi:MAG: hypothetical protein P4M09_11860 [Devosia sp.]|nr:hypothetical protein [Devosia sp.]
MVWLISVLPLGEGWSVRLDEIANDMIFLSGAGAERSARRLGERLADAGEHAEIRIYARDGNLVGRFVCQPDTQTHSPAADAV